MRAAVRAAALAACALLLAGAAPKRGPVDAARPLTLEELAGRRIYRDGEGSGEITALVGRSAASVPATALPCGSCHGEDGLGRPEGGAAPSDITWSRLTRAYGHEHPGRRHPPFDERSIARAITSGVDPAGHPLDGAMPRYSMSATDMRHLLAYLRRLEHDSDPGITDGALRFAILLPSGGPLAEPAAAMRAVVEEVFAEANRSGGINGRRLELEVTSHDGSAGSAAAAARDAARSGRVFALVSGLFPAAERDVAAAVEAERVPLIAPFSLDPPRADGSLTQAFFATSGAADQVRALVRHASRPSEADASAAPQRVRSLAIVNLEGTAQGDAVEAARDEARARGLAAHVHAATVEGLPKLARELASAGDDAVVFLGGDDALAAFASAAGSAGYAPLVLVPAALATAARVDPASPLAGRVLLAFPTPPFEPGAPAAAAVARVARAAGLGERHRQAQVSAYAAAIIVKEALRRCGRRVSRARLVSALEGIYAFDAGLGAPVTFGPSRRVGARGAYLVRPDPAAGTYRPVGWVALDGRT